jgi:hypothetical protein
VRALCDDTALAPFEKNKAIRSATEWLSRKVLGPKPDFMAALFFFHRSFGVPKSETMVYVSDVSLQVYEKSLKLAAMSGLLALWLGYSDTSFLSQFVESVFCQEIDPTPAIALERLSSGLVPGVGEADRRFQSRLAFSGDTLRAAGDELASIVEAARVLIGEGQGAKADVMVSRVVRKLSRQFGLEFGGVKAAGAERGAA